jgi:hypothetical protein
MIESSEGGFRLRYKKERAEKNVEYKWRKKWLENDARQNENWKWLIYARIVLLWL